MYNRLQSYLAFYITNNLDLEVITELVHNIYNSFNKNKYNRCFFIDLSTTEDHKILLKQVQLYGVQGDLLKLL